MDYADKCALVTLPVLPGITLLAMATSSTGAVVAFNEGYALAGAWPYVHPLLLGLFAAIACIPLYERVVSRPGRRGPT